MLGGVPDLFVGAAVGAVVAQAYTDLYKVAKDAISKVMWCKKQCRELARELEIHRPVFDHICSHIQVPARQWEQPLLDFKERLDQGRLLVENCMMLSVWHPIERLRYSKAILKLQKDILQHLQNLAAFNTVLLQQLCEYQPVLAEQQNRLQEAVDPLMATMRQLQGSSDRNAARIMQWVRQASPATTSEPGSVQMNNKRSVDELHVPEFLVGLDGPISEVKSLLFSNDQRGVVAIVGGMGGIGKTTLALALCKDTEVREFFQERIHFITVSQSPNMTGLLTTIWQQVIGGTAPLFQNEEDAYMQLQGKLLANSRSRFLLVLDDVWSKANLEKLVFQGEQCRTLVTTRQASVLQTRNSSTYTLGLLTEEDALRLFCYWAFGQEYIPDWADEMLVKETRGAAGWISALEEDLLSTRGFGE